MIRELLTDTGLNFNIRTTDKGEEYAGFKLIFGDEEFYYTAIYRNDGLRIILHEALKPCDGDEFYGFLNAFNEKWLTCKYYYNARVGFVEASATILNIDKQELGDQIWFHLRHLHETDLRLRTLVAGSPAMDEDQANPTPPVDPAFLPTLKSLLIGAGYTARWKFDRSVLATNLLTPSALKVILEFIIVNNDTLFVRSYNETVLREDKVKFFLARMQCYNWAMDTGTVALNSDELKYYFFQAFPLRFLARARQVDTAFIEQRIAQSIKAHEYIYQDLQTSD